MEIAYSNDLNNSYFSKYNFIGFIGEINDLKTIIKDINYSYIKPNYKVKKFITINDEYLKILGLDINILKHRIKELSDTEIKLIKLIKICEMQPKLIVLNNFDLGFNYKEKSKISRFIKTINAEYKTNFIIISNDSIFLNKNVKHVIISKNKIIKYQGDIINAIKQGFIEKPPIIKFIDLANKSNAKLTYTLDNKELLKDIYRSVF